MKEFKKTFILVVKVIYEIYSIYCLIKAVKKNVIELMKG